MPYTINENTEFIIGIDFGHGETSAAYYSLRDENEPKKDIDILPGKPVIPSAVAILSQEGVNTICVGAAAIQAAPNAREFQISFKRRPSEMTVQEKQRMIAFMKGVYDAILDCHPDYRTIEHGVFIARPSNDKLWKGEEDAYIEMAEEAGIPIAGIQKESRAAYFRARTQSGSKIDQQVKEGVLIVDFGSSTIDLTYLNKDLKEPIDGGFNLGANAVETALLKFAFAHPQDSILSQFQQYYGDNTSSNAYNQLLYKFRESKEAFYGQKLFTFSVTINYGLITSAEERHLQGFGGISLKKDDVRTILESEEYGNYIGSIEKAIISFKQEKLEGYEVACVFLTGGASRMDFVREIFMKVFNLQPEQCVLDDGDTASRIVSQGVAHLSYADYKTQAKGDELRAKAFSIIENFDWDEQLRNSISKTVKSTIIDRMYNLMDSYRKGDIYEELYLIEDDYIDENGVKHWIDTPIDYDRNGIQKIRNMRALRSKIKETFDNYVNFDFANECTTLIKENVVAVIEKELRNAFETFNFKGDDMSDFSYMGLSVILNQDGADVLTARFTAEGKGHVLYDAVDSRYMTMIGWDLYKDRWDYSRENHFNYYKNNYKHIFNNEGWKDFIKKYIVVRGIPQAKEQLKDYVKGWMEEYISYARLSIFLN